MFKKYFAMFCAAALMAAAVSGCVPKEDGGNGEEPVHVHTYAQEWSTNGGYHWHEPTCDDTDQVSERGEHRYIGTDVCRVCGFDRSLYGMLTIADTAILPDLPEGKFSAQFSDPDKAEPLEYTYDTSALTIDAEEQTIKVLKEGVYTVEAVSAHYFAKFTVTATQPDFSNKGLYDTNSRFSATISSRAAEWAEIDSEQTTVFIGDSFFDPWGWADFYTDYAGKDVRLLGISSTTSCHWEQILAEDMIFAQGTAVPAAFVVNVGTNNFYDDGLTYEQTLVSIQKMFQILHVKFPQAKIYYYSITQRTNTAYQKQVSDTNSAMKAWCGLYDWITFVDTAGQITSSDLRDGVHLTPQAYRSIFMPALEEAGCVIADTE